MAALGLAAAGFGLAAWRGAPFVPVLKSEVAPLISLADLQPGQTLLDLGFGDGRLLKAAALKGARVIGYEINPWLYLWGWLNLWPVRHQTELHLSDFWLESWPPADVIVVFLIESKMAKLEQRLARLDRPTRVVSYIYAIPGREAIKTTRNGFVYQFGPAD